MTSAAMMLISPGATSDKTSGSSRPQSAAGMAVGKFDASDDIGIETHQEQCDVLEVANKENEDGLL